METTKEARLDDLLNNTNPEREDFHTMARHLGPVHERYRTCSPVAASGPICLIEQPLPKNLGRTLITHPTNVIRPS